MKNSTTQCVGCQQAIHRISEGCQSTPCQICGQVFISKHLADSLSVKKCVDKMHNLTIEEVKKVAIECGINDEYWYDYSEELQAFAQHYLEECMKEQIESNAKLCLSRHANGNYKYDTREDCAKPSATTQENEMTTPKEDQMRAEFEEVHAGANFTKSMLGYYIDIDVAEKWLSWKACAESYEKKLADCVAATASIHNLHVALEKSYAQKLAEKDAEIKQWQRIIDEENKDHIEQLYESNARNAMLELHINELRDALRKLLQLVIYQVGAEYTDAARDVLAKQPDTSALDKALLEARIEELDDVRLDFDIQEKLTVYKARLAELNKE